LVKRQRPAIPEHNFDEVGLPTPEHKEMAREGILPQHALDQHREPIDTLAHVDIHEVRPSFRPSMLTGSGKWFMRRLQTSRYSSQAHKG
jgi:hypothetical protein